MPKDFEGAYGKFDQLCTAGYAPACSDLVVMLGSPNGPHTDPARARQVAKQACDGNDGDGCFYLGAMLLKGVGGGADERAADPVMTKACELGNTQACQMWGAYEAFAATPPRAADGVKLLRIGCDHDDAKSCHALAVLVQNGNGVTADPKAAFVLARHACDLGEVAACTLVGLDMMQTAGAGSAGANANAADAVAMFQRACRDGVDDADPAGCYFLAASYQQGLAVARDPDRALKLFTRACDHDWADACEHLGEMYDRGNDVPHDADKAKELFNRGCDKGSKPACVAVGRPAPPQ
jgi:TPR repeat protein